MLLTSFTVSLHAPKGSDQWQLDEAVASLELRFAIARLVQDRLDECSALSEVHVRVEH